MLKRNPDALACYVIEKDHIVIKKYNFNNFDILFSIYHELAHSTGHETRLKRKPIGMKRVKKQQELYEELTAEFTAILLCKKCRIFNKVRQSIARNIINILVQIKKTNWEKRLECYDQAIQAKKYILGEIKKPISSN